MFGRYTEKARRVIFFTRYEASQFGSLLIEPEHLLLGVLREDTRFARTPPTGAVESARKRVEELTPPREKVTTSVDLPLSNSAKRVLVYAEDEADRLHHRHIACEHMVLGLLHETESTASNILANFGVRAEQMRSIAQANADDPSNSGRVLPSSYRGRRARFTDIIKLRGEIWDAHYVREAVRRCCDAGFHWRMRSWKPRDAIVDRKTGKLSLDLTLAEDSANFELVKDGWKKDLCAICRGSYSRPTTVMAPPTPTVATGCAWNVTTDSGAGRILSQDHSET